jgi:hypothetical protein
MPSPRRGASPSFARVASLVAGAASLVGCASIASVDEWDPTAGPSGSSATSSTSTTTGSGGAGAGTGTSSSSGTQGGGGNGNAGGALPVSGAIELDGEGAHVSFEPTAAFTATTGFTWELWFRAEQLPTETVHFRQHTLFGAMDDQPCEDIYLGFGSNFSPGNELAFVVDRSHDDDAIACATEFDGDPVKASGYNFQPATWYHVAAVADYAANQTLLYVNGVLVGTRTKSGKIIDRPLLVRAGGWSDGPTQDAYFPGSIDELRIYGVPLSAATIEAHYNDGQGTYGMPEPDLVAGWHFDEGTGTLADDYAGVADGTRVNGEAWGPGLVVEP